MENSSQFIVFGDMNLCLFKIRNLLLVCLIAASVPHQCARFQIHG